MSRDFSALGHALSSPARTTFLNMLMDGSSRPAGELARSAGVSPATASEHLAVLTKAGLIQCQVRGRQRFYALTNSTVAAALETTSPAGSASPCLRPCRITNGSATTSTPSQSTDVHASKS